MNVDVRQSSLDASDIGGADAREGIGIRSAGCARKARERNDDGSIGGSRHAAMDVRRTRVTADKSGKRKSDGDRVKNVVDGDRRTAESRRAIDRNRLRSRQANVVNDVVCSSLGGSQEEQQRTNGDGGKAFYMASGTGVRRFDRLATIGFEARNSRANLKKLNISWTSAKRLANSQQICKFLRHPVSTSPRRAPSGLVDPAQAVFADSPAFPNRSHECQRPSTRQPCGSAPCPASGASVSPA